MERDAPWCWRVLEWLWIQRVANLSQSRRASATRNVAGWYGRLASPARGLGMIMWYSSAQTCSCLKSVNVLSVASQQPLLAIECGKQAVEWCRLSFGRSLTQIRQQRVMLCQSVWRLVSARTVITLTPRLLTWKRSFTPNPFAPVNRPLAERKSGIEAAVDTPAPEVSQAAN